MATERLSNSPVHCPTAPDIHSGLSLASRSCANTAIVAPQCHPPCRADDVATRTLSLRPLQPACLKHIPHGVTPRRGMPGRSDFRHVVERLSKSPLLFLSQPFQCFCERLSIFAIHFPSFVPQYLLARCLSFSLPSFSLYFSKRHFPRQAVRRPAALNSHSMVIQMVQETPLLSHAAPTEARLEVGCL